MARQNNVQVRDHFAGHPLKVTHILKEMIYGSNNRNISRSFKRGQHANAQHLFQYFNHFRRQIFKYCQNTIKVASCTDLTYR